MPSMSLHAGRVRLRVPPSSTECGLRLSAVAGAGSLQAGGRAAVFWLVLRGHAEVQAREGDFALGPGDWIALDGDSAPRCLSRPGSLLLGADMASNAVPLLPGRGRMPARGRARALRLWRAAGAFDNDVADAVAVDAVRVFLSAIQAELAGRIERCPGHSERRKRQVLLRMQRARLCLEGQGDGGLRIGELARRIHFSPWYFSKLFHALYGIAPQQFSVRMRLERAGRLLKTTRLPVTEVSAACGFDNPCSFARAFRSRFGTTASDYRMRYAAAIAGSAR